MKVNRTHLHLTTLLLLLASLFCWNGVLELRAEEPRRAIVTLEMLLGGDLWVPHIHGWTYYNKPPVFNWWMLGFFKLLGSVDEWVVRIPSLVALIFTGLLNFFIVRKYLTREVALFSSLFFVTCADILFYGSINSGEIDLFFCMLVYAQIMCIYVFFKHKRYLWMFLLSYLLAAVGTLTKGPPSIAFQVLTLLPWLLIHRQWKLLLGWKHFLGIMLFILVTGGYFFIYSFQDDAAGFMVRLFKEASQRTGIEHNFLDTVKASALFPLYLAQWLAPWSLLVLFFVRKDFLTVIKTNPLLLFAAIFILFNIPIYWFTADHKARYLYMFFPVFCILFSYFFINRPATREHWKLILDKFFLVIMAIGTLAFIAVPFLPQATAIPDVMWRCLFIAAAGSGLIILYLKLPEWKFSVFIIFILLVRLGFNVTYLPASVKHSTSMIYKDHIDNIIAITGEESVHWTGKPMFLNLMLR